MTNREKIVGLLQDENFIDDGGVSYEAMIYYNIACPYSFGDDRAVCYEDGEVIDELVNRKNCVICKEKWLDSEVDE